MRGPKLVASARLSTCIKLKLITAHIFYRGGGPNEMIASGPNQSYRNHHFCRCLRSPMRPALWMALSLRIVHALDQRCVFQKFGLLLSSMAPTNLRCPLPVRCATNLVADVEVESRCLLNFFRRSINTKSYTSTPRNQPKVHKYSLRCFIFATESSYACKAGE